MARELREGLSLYKANPQFAEDAYAHGMTFGWDPVIEKYIELFRNYLR